MADLFKILLAEKLGHCDSLYESVIGKKLGGYSWLSDYETTPYLYRAMPNLSHYYNREIMEEVVGGSVGWNQILPNPTTSQTINDITFTVNADGSVTMNGTATADARFYYSPRTDYLKDHVYLVTGVPVGGSETTYRALVTTWNYTDEIKKFTANDYYGVRIEVYSGVTVNNVKFALQCFDLTLALGSTIADYVYSLEQATAGSGVAWLKEHFPKMFGQYNPYDAGSIQSVSGLVSHDTVGFNQWDEEWEVGALVFNNASEDFGENSNATNQMRSKNYTPVMPNETYYFKAGSGVKGFMIAYDSDKKGIKTAFNGVGLGPSGQAWTMPSDCHYVRFYCIAEYGTTYKNDICINLSDASRNGQYEPYRKSSYPLDSTLTLRGIPKLDNGKLYYDGDTYGADGSVSRKYGVDIVDGVNVKVKAWGVTNDYGGFTCYASFDNLDYVHRNLSVCDKFTCPNQSISNAPIMSCGLGSGGAGTFNFILPATITSADEANAWFASNPTTVVYPLATPTTETAQPFTKTQLCDSGGTEEFVTSGIVSVGHKSKYAEK